MSNIFDTAEEPTMSMREKMSWVSVLTSVFGSLAYGVVVLLRTRESALTEVAYVGPMLTLMGVAMGVSIIAEVVITATRPEDAGEDDRDREIRRYGMYVGHFFGVVGGVVALALAMAQQAHFFIAHALYVGFLLSSVVGTAVRLRAYRVGVPR